LDGTPSAQTSLCDLIPNTLHSDFCLFANGQIVSRKDLIAHAVALSEQLPAKKYAINLCQDRYLFIVAYLAVYLRQQISLLPSNQAPNTLADLSLNYPDSYTLGDHKTDIDYLIRQDLLTKSTKPCPNIDINRPVSIAFTSGSTGKPKAISKTWREFQHSAQLALAQLALQKQHITLLSTVPMQHMYGLETGFFWVFFSQMTLHNSHPFYPEDIRNTLSQLPNTNILVSTPRHLKTCSQTSNQWPPLKFILSSTAPMSTALAQQIEQSLQAPLFELLGSTETLSFASRQPSQTTQWQAYAGIQLIQHQQQFILQGGHITTPITLDDTFAIQDDGKFSLLGRAGDLIKIAGKRASLHDLNQKLTQINGVDDGLFFHSKNERLSALVVSQLPKKTIIDQLKHVIDPVFLPRAIYPVTALPRNNMGKIRQAELEQLIRTQQMQASQQSYCIPATHPCLAGHFPNKPIVPGVVILNYVQQQLLANFPDTQIVTLTQAKFLQPLHPEENFSISLSQSAAQHIKFTCTRENERLVTGSFMIAAKTEHTYEQ